MLKLANTTIVMRTVVNQMKSKQGATCAKDDCCSKEETICDSFKEDKDKVKTNEKEVITDTEYEVEAEDEDYEEEEA